jgi:DNA invertase Pin-like site-specific DNA recombinase
VETKTAAIYARVSTKQQSVDSQLHQLKAVAASDGYTDIKIFLDEGISGSKGRDKRPGLDNLLKAATRREIDKVYVFSIDRIGRSVTDLISTLEEIQAANVGIYFHKQAIDTSTPSGKLLFNLVAVFSSYEREIIRERVLAGLEKAKANGVRLGRKPLAPIIAKQIKERRDRGDSVRKVARALRISTATVSRYAKASKDTPFFSS